ncbi:hypothetical protein HW555_006085 [Spodoptera exigua]|uniref:Uncharacterized protein n=1 Tax=Spodoptera exigua TaxID=7107 RepID=A0A835L6U9_SPOEX|nr:hypothetical protein HW555_006085 [Spodoptera exigua]
MYQNHSKLEKADSGEITKAFKENKTNVEEKSFRQATEGQDICEKKEMTVLPNVETTLAPPTADYACTILVYR